MWLHASQVTKEPSFEADFISLKAAIGAEELPFDENHNFMKLLLGVTLFEVLIHWP